ncbi:MAG: adenosylcobalamin-dependent ribonucleoside-diphosphate reductase [Chitinispirillia bacterium]|jgi:ribonucleoside-diphosphate reductase alpha chain
MKKDLDFLSENGLKVLEKRYLKKDTIDSIIETPADMFMRVVNAVSDVEKIYSKDPAELEKVKDKFTDLLFSGDFLPNSPTLMNAGREMGLLSACFVLPIEDSIDSIFETVKITALIQKAGGGTGFSFDKLRPTGDHISTSGGKTSGPISFWKVLAETTNAIQQGAFRRGANMGMMSITHPDILKFIISKQDLNNFTNFNISIKITDAWMKCYHDNKKDPHIVTNKRTNSSYVIPKSIDLKNYVIQDLLPKDAYYNDTSQKNVEVWTNEEIFNLIVECAWKTGEPGLIFIDEINRGNPTPEIGAVEATNPCGEQPLLPYEACNLGAIDVSKFVENCYSNKTMFNWKRLGNAIYNAVHFLENIIDINRYPAKEIETRCRGNRKIGLGLMGFADTLFLLGIPYNSDRGVEFGEKLMKFLNDQSHSASEKLAEKRGCFPNWRNSVWDKKHNRKMRNASTTTIAPTGTISIISDCSGGIEPLFSLTFYRNILQGEKLIEVNKIFKKTLEKKGMYSEKIVSHIRKNGTIKNYDGIPDSLKKVFVCSHDIAPGWHLKMQAAFQRHCDSSISKTINLPEHTVSDDIKKIYIKAWKLRCKGVTVYRDGCRKSQPMDTHEKSKTSLQKENSSNKFPIKTPDILSAVRIRQNTPFGHMHVSITVDPDTEKELEVFAQLGKAGDIAMSDLEAISRLISLYLRSGGALVQVINQLEGIGSHLSIPTKDGRVMSIADGLGKTLQRYLEAKQKYGLLAILTGKINFSTISLKKNGSENGKNPNVDGSREIMDKFKIKCPDCNEAELRFTEGCVTCDSCGFSQC